MTACDILCTMAAEIDAPPSICGGSLSASRKNARGLAEKRDRHRAVLPLVLAR